MISSNLKIFATMCTSAVIGALGAELWANTKYDGALEGYRNAGSTELRAYDKVVVAYATCDIAQGTKIERRMPKEIAAISKKR